MSDIDVVIWGYRADAPFSVSVGHVMITYTGTHDVVLSQFPHRPGTPRVARGPNICFTYAQTIAEEARPASAIYRLKVPNLADFEQTAQGHRSRLVWDWDPMQPQETHCARSSYDSLKAAAFDFDPLNQYVAISGQRKQIIPNTLWVLLDRSTNATCMEQTEGNLPESERLAFEADVSRYVPFSDWHSMEYRRRIESTEGWR
ncbi:hypothetical protein [Cupriavidus sp. TMH.W2]|uniref:hypothetical protein n=1 Tax=Cupriavidus sp. TMH.W2 TaxID=3434465 RepID=UPI003D78ABE2